MDRQNVTQQDFKARLVEYKQAIDETIAAYSRQVSQRTRTEYGRYPAIVTDAFVEFLSRGGKRIRGALVMAGYELCGGQNREMILRAAMALEMIHAYILAVDDIQDRSKVRRGKPTVHEALAVYHRQQHLRGDADHAGISFALNAALEGAHAAQLVLTSLDVPDDLKLKAVNIVNQTMITTVHGQTTDIMNELTEEVTADDVEHTLEWKTAHYTVLNPLCVGMVLAGASCPDTDAIREYALHTGKAFQITDDIIGVFGDDDQTGKSSMDDLREGKRTVITEYAFAHASVVDKKFLRHCLGNEMLMGSDFERCRQILTLTGALANARQLAEDHVRLALGALDVCPEHWDTEVVLFLRDLTSSLVGRKT